MVFVQESGQAVRSTHRLGRAAFDLVPILVICALWFPVFWAYHVPAKSITDGMVQQARESPSDATLGELEDFHFLTLGWKNKQEIIEAASGLLDGNMRIGTCSARITIGFSARDLDHIPPACEFLFAAFTVPDVLLQAYDATGRKDFLAGAGAFITGAQAYEQTIVFPRGEFWNDHAVAARVVVLANFWRVYRRSPEYQPEIGRRVLQMVAVSEQLLAKPGLFMFATNHGIMQNLALWHASLAFPSLPGAEQYQHLARARITDQMTFYISGEGVILEHSAGYHLFGTTLVGMACRYLGLMHQPVPEEWIEKYERAKKFYAALRRPDGSVPIFGDTSGESEPLGPLVTTFDEDRRPHPLAYQPAWKPPAAVNLYPVSGYAIWWDGLQFWPNLLNLSQTVVTWSDFPSQAHKHADEMSVLFWAGGQNWLNNIGYWPYENKWRGTIESWPGSNAPHLVGENASSPRNTKLISSGSSDNLAMLELERRGTKNYIVRRQVIHWQPSFWIVVDSTLGPENRRTTTTWTSPPNVSWQQRQAPGGFHLESDQTNTGLDLFLLGSSDTTQHLARGSSRPFAGWQLEHGVPVPASALVVDQPAKNSWAATIWIWQNAGPGYEGSPQMAEWTDVTHWEMQLPGEAETVVLRREGNVLRLHSGGKIDETLQLTGTSSDVDGAITELRRQFMASSSRYHPFFDNIAKRKKLTYLLLVFFLVQQVFFFVYKRMHGKRVYTLQLLNVILWIVGGIWLLSFYL